MPPPSEAHSQPSPPFQERRLHPHGFCSHERRIEADAELADEVDIFLGGLGQLLKEMLGSGMGDGAQIGFQFFLGHADAGVGDGQGMVFIVAVDGDFQRHVGVELHFFDQALVPEFFQGIGGVGDQFADKDVALGVERVDDDIQDLSGLRLKLLGFNLCFCHGAVPLNVGG